MPTIIKTDNDAFYDKFNKTKKEFKKNRILEDNYFIKNIDCENNNYIDHINDNDISYEQFKVLLSYY